MPLPNLPSEFAGREYLRVGGGYGAPATGQSPAGGLDVDNAGNFAASGDGAIDGALTVGSVGDLTFTGDLKAGAGGVDRTWNVSLPADRFWPDSTNGPTGPTLTQFTGNRYEAMSLGFPTAINRRAYALIALPADYDGSFLKVMLYWTVTDAGASGDVRWAIGSLFAEAGDTIKDYSGSTPFAEATATLSGVGDLQITEISIIATETKPTLWLSLLRDGANSFDTLGVDALFIGARLEYA